MQTSIAAETIQETMTYLKSRINQLETTILGLSPAFCPLYGTIEFAQLTPESFDTPYAMHTMRIPTTKQNVTFITTPPHLVIGTPASGTPGPLHWDEILEIELPPHTIFVNFRYGGVAGDIEWYNASGYCHPLPALPPLPATVPFGEFYLARSEGIHSIKITRHGEMFLDTLAVGMSAS